MRRLSYGLGALALVACSRRASTESEPSPNVVAVVKYSATSTERGTQLLTDARRTFAAKASLFIAADTGMETDGIAIGPAHADSIVASPTAPRNAHHRVTVRLPKLADGPVGLDAGLDAGAMRVEVRPRGFSARALEWSENVAIYPEIAPRIDAFRVLREEGWEDLYVAREERSELMFTYDVKLSGVAGLRLVDDTLELLDASGAPRVRATRPIVVDAAGVERAGTLEVSGCAYDTRAIGPWNRPVTAPGSETCTVVARIDGRALKYPVLVDPAWETTGRSKQTHAYSKLVVLTAGPDKGRVVQVGGTGTMPSVTELFDPTSTTWATSAALPSALGAGMAAAGFDNGVVLAAGGFSSGASGTALATALVRNPNSGQWFSAASMDARAYHQMVPITIGGKNVVLAIGGQTSSYLSTSAPPIAGADYYEPPAIKADGTFDFTSGDNWFGPYKMNGTRTKHRATVLADGRVLVAGGESFTTFTTFLSTAEIFDPVARTWSTTGNMNVVRSSAELQALASGGAVVAGGATADNPNTALDSVEYFDGTKWTLLGPKLSTPRWMFASARLTDGRVLFAGGEAYAPSVGVYTLDSSDLFVPASDPLTSTINGAGSMGTARWALAMVTTSKGALAAGGLTTSASVGSETTASDLFDTAVGDACGGGCPSGLTCVDSVCCKLPPGATSCDATLSEKCNNPGREGLCTRPNGSVCGNNSQCSSGYCVGGFCCENACSGGCKTCDATGKCINTAAGTDPGGFCTGSYDPTCGHKCDGKGACSLSFAPEGTPCGSSISDAGTGTFCTVQSCSPYGYCLSKSNTCGLTCTTSVVCSEATKSCTGNVTGIKPGKCIIGNVCYEFGDINPMDSCQMCDPPTSKTDWSVADSCMEAGVDTGTGDDTGTGGDDSSSIDTGSVDTGPADTSTDTYIEPLDTAMMDDVGPDAADTPADLPEASACGCHTPGRDSSGEHVLGLAALGLAFMVSRLRH